MIRELINFKTDSEGITIFIPKTLLVHVATHHPEGELKVINADEFTEKVAFEMEHNTGWSESGLTGFQRLIDLSIVDVVESGEDCVEIIGDNN